MALKLASLLRSLCVVKGCRTPEYTFTDCHMQYATISVRCRDDFGSAADSLSHSQSLGRNGIIKCPSLAFDFCNNTPQRMTPPRNSTEEQGTNKVPREGTEGRKPGTVP